MTDNQETALSRRVARSFMLAGITTAAFALLALSADSKTVVAVAACVTIVVYAGVAVITVRNITSALRTRTEQLSDASARIGGASVHLMESAQMTAAQAEQVEVAAKDVTKKAQNVMMDVEDMGFSIAEISMNATTANEVADSARSMADDTNVRVSRLGESSERIGKVVEVITSIAEQTNLLALNATIEAARAGDAGKGFAVVANEVKDLAKATASATDEIGRLVTEIQQDTTNAVAGIGDITSIIHQINELQSSIVNSVDEQTKVTGSIATSIAEAVQDIGMIRTTSEELVATATTTSALSGEAEEALGLVARVAGEFDALVPPRSHKVDGEQHEKRANIDAERRFMGSHGVDPVEERSASSC